MKLVLNERYGSLIIEYWVSTNLKHVHTCVLTLCLPLLSKFLQIHKKHNLACLSLRTGCTMAFIPVFLLEASQRCKGAVKHPDYP